MPGLGQRVIYLLLVIQPAMIKAYICNLKNIFISLIYKKMLNGQLCPAWSYY